MMSSSAIVICLIGIIISIILSYKFNVNIGVTGLAFAFIVGCFMMKMTVNEVVALYPTALTFQIMVICLFFGFATCNGTMKILANHILYSVRNRKWMIAFALYLIAIILGALGCPPPATTVISGVIGISVGLAAGLHPLIIAWSVLMGSVMGSLVTWGANGAVIKGIIASVGYEAQSDAWTWRAMLAFFVISTLILIVLFLVFKGYKLSDVSVEKPESFTREQRISLTIILVVVLLVVIPSLLTKLTANEAVAFFAARMDIRVLAVIGFVLCTLLKLANPMDVIKSVPWANIILIGGIGTLMAVATQAGVVDLLANWLNSSVPVMLKVPFMTLIGAILSCFSSGIPTVFPMLAPVVTDAVVGTSIKPITMFIGILIGCDLVSTSPFAAGGALFLSFVQDEELRKKMVNWMLILTLAATAIVLVLGAVGFWGLF